VLIFFSRNFLFFNNEFKNCLFAELAAIIQMKIVTPRFAGSARRLRLGRAWAVMIALFDFVFCCCPIECCFFSGALNNLFMDPPPGRPSGAAEPSCGGLGATAPNRHHINDPNQIEPKYRHWNILQKDRELSS
jgi:hypothetical protein